MIINSYTDYTKALERAEERKKLFIGFFILGSIILYSFVAYEFGYAHAVAVQKEKEAKQTMAISSADADCSFTMDIGTSREVTYLGRSLESTKASKKIKLDKKP